jgi:hypothetical protein
MDVSVRTMLNEALEIVDARVYVACGHPERVDVVRMCELIDTFRDAQMPMWAEEAARCVDAACGMETK